MSSTAAQLRTRTSRIAETAYERARLTVVPRRRTRASRMPFVALVSMVLLGGVVGLLLFNTSMQQASFAATALEGQATTLTARQQALQMDLDRLRNPQRIAEKARRLGMVQAASPAFITLGSGTVEGVAAAGDGTVPFRIDPLPPKKPAILTPAPHVVTVQSDVQSDVQPDESGDTSSGDRGNGAGRDRMSQNR